ncbi:UDP-glucuronosyltransferase 2B7 [Anoplophora glabripennis]|uniref:UDP-glucuronosyltransferase 2B7 n=1 Tax=Anoplophora glabripennis TaxID=217634 RepID=UPI0008752AE5|nr:UDP-glucuronosyltransferase 2B7 [Anoplophora glabripennis]
MWWSALCVLSVASVASCGNILALVPAPFYSHQIAFAQIWKELSLRGHHVTLMTTVPHRDPTLINLTEIDTSNAFQIVTHKYQISKTAENILNMWNWYDIFAQINSDAAEEQLSNPKVQELIHKRNNFNFDVVFVESYYAEFLAFGKLYNCPTVLTTSVDGHTLFQHAMGNPAHPILHTDYATPFHGKLTFRERVISTIYSVYVSLFETFYVLPGKQRIIDKYFTNMSLKLESLISDVDMMFLDVNPVIQDARAIGPTTINIGMERNIVPKRPLTKDLKDFMDNAKEGFIYFSLGSNVRSKELNHDTLTAIVQAFKEIPYKVVWKFEGDDLPGKPDNVKLVRWAPQQIVLKHPNIKLFITQGGLQSMEEAVYSKVPMVVIPFFFDQFKNARLMEIKHIGKTIGRKPSVKKDELKNAIIEVITDPKYINSVRRLGRLSKDVPMTGLEKAIWWTEYIIRNKGAKHLRNPASDIPFYQYFLLDVISFIIVVTFCILIVLCIFVKKSVQVVRGILRTMTTKSKKLE